MEEEKNAVERCLEIMAQGPHECSVRPVIFVDGKLTRWLRRGARLRGSETGHVRGRKVYNHSWIHISHDGLV